MISLVVVVVVVVVVVDSVMFALSHVSQLVVDDFLSLFVVLL